MKNLIILLSLLGATFVFGQQAPKTFSSQVNEYFNALADIQNFNGNVLVAKNGRVVLEESYRMKDSPNQIAVTKNSRFLIASLSKLFTRYAILKLVDLGTIKMDDPLNNFISDFPSGDKITVEYLLEHKSGLPRELSVENYEELPLSEIAALAKNEKLLFTPGSQNRYSNLAYFLLQYIIDTRSEKGYSEFINQEILKKMNMPNTGVYQPGQAVADLATGYDLVGDKIIQAPAAELQAVNNNYFSTAADLYNFGEQLLSGKTIPKKLAERLFATDSVIIQSGGLSGYRSYYYKSLKTGITFIFLANYTDIPFQNITEDFTKILNRNPYKLPTKGARVKKEQPLEVLQRYVGKYALALDRNQVFSIHVEKGELYFTDAAGNILMIPENEFTFFENPKSRDSFIFEEDEKTKKYDLILMVNDVKMKTIRIE